MKNKFLFIDRDGTIIDEPINDFKVDSIEKLKFKENVFTSLLNLKKKNYKFVMVTNQDGLGTNEFPEDKFYFVQNFIIKMFLSQKIKFYNIFICPHYIFDNCKCRKPNIGMLSEFLKNNKLDKNNSFVIGDRDTDIEFANNIGIKGILYKKNYNWKKVEKKILYYNNITIFRKTKETSIKIKVNLEKYYNSNINTGIKFFDHMLNQLAFHARIYLYIKSIGDINIDDHHTVEDVAITLGKSFLKSIVLRTGINRFGLGIVPMDESISKCVLDISGRPYICFKSNLKNKFLGNFNLNMVKHFFYSLSYSMKSTIHISSYGENDHHICESIFKSFGIALRKAIFINSNYVQSSKGILL
ncbi:bifunctional histidinol-phosphatase/imidazoleglycerol-phosphate dehydratase HisB [Buchnera aphidicola (Ceratovacuna keduensis)]|uniref:bifunctional histidinol-phosphatase/imidazoleglycerol-phosphate dehydratase HisB n=1 Tax=Buchnera aphidicola TaxID=9 RepID=UPI0031B7F604